MCPWLFGRCQMVISLLYVSSKNMVEIKTITFAKILNIYIYDISSTLANRCLYSTLTGRKETVYIFLSRRMRWVF